MSFQSLLTSIPFLSVLGSCLPIDDTQKIAFGELRNSSEFCSANSGVSIVDTSVPVTQGFLSEMKAVGITSVARYYDYGKNVGDYFPGRKETITGKTISKSEADLIRKNGFSLIAVFQHKSDQANTFMNWESRAKEDADVVATLSKLIEQPENSTVYFGVDGDLVRNTARGQGCTESAKKCDVQVLEYFRVVNAELEQKKLKVGVYGSGSTCRMLTESGLATSCWLSFSTAHGRPADRASVIEDNLVEIVQQKEGQCGGRNVDFNFVRSNTASAGAFR